MRKTVRALRKHPRFLEMSGLVLLLVAVLCAGSLMSYDGRDATWFHDTPDGGSRSNVFGWVGAHLAELLLQTAGIPAYALPVFLAIGGWRRLRGRKAMPSIPRAVGLAALFVGTAALLDSWFRDVSIAGGVFHPGGWVGASVGGAAAALLSGFGARLVLAVAVATLIVALTRVSLVEVAVTLSRWSAAGAARGGAGLREAWRGYREGLRESGARAATPPPDPVPTPEPAPPIESASTPSPAPAPAAGPTMRPAKKPPAPPQRRLPLDPPSSRNSDEFRLPGLDLLNAPRPQPSENERALYDRARQLTEKFAEFQVQGRVVEIHPGPVVTTFEFQPEAGVKYSKIVNMTDDLCLALKAESVRIDRVPGASTVGIEVPNRAKETIYPVELLASDRFAASGSKLTLALGKDIHGEVFTAALDRMPHLLIAGATGAGKSVMLNGMIVSMLFKSTPADTRMIMIDTKMIELGIYADIPHLLIPVVTDPKKASTALKWAVREMEIRYKKLAALGVRNLGQFNDKLEREPDAIWTTEKGDEIPLRPLPFIVIVIDEMADLMMVSSADVEESIMRLAQMARAVGIHLILATQRPSVDVITGTIKANFPSRIAFRVSQRVDSRTIIDQNGAEQLLGRGDMLFLATGSSRLKRLHSGYFTEDEVHRIVDHLKDAAEPEYDESVLEDPDEIRGPGGEVFERDEMFVDAVRLVLQEGTCSITLIQRRLRLGYARAARIVDSMEQQGIVGPADGAKPREILVGSDYLETLEVQVS